MTARKIYYLFAIAIMATVILVEYVPDDPLWVKFLMFLPVWIYVSYLSEKLATE